MVDTLEKLHNASLSSVTPEKTQDVPPPPVNYIMLVILEIAQSLVVETQTAQINAKILQVNTQDQEKLNSEAEGMNFIVFTKNMMYTTQKVKHTKRYNTTWSVNVKKVVYYTFKRVAKPSGLQSVQDKNMQIQKERDNVTNQILLLRQTAQTQQAGLNTVVDNSQQTDQEVIALLQMTLTVANQISQSR